MPTADCVAGAQGGEREVSCVPHLAEHLARRACISLLGPLVAPIIVGDEEQELPHAVGVASDVSKLDRGLDQI